MDFLYSLLPKNTRDFHTLIHTPQSAFVIPFPCCLQASREGQGVLVGRLQGFQPIVPNGLSANRYAYQHLFCQPLWHFGLQALSSHTLQTGTSERYFSMSLGPLSPLGTILWNRTYKRDCHHPRVVDVLFTVSGQHGLP